VRKNTLVLVWNVLVDETFVMFRANGWDDNRASNTRGGSWGDRGGSGGAPLSRGSPNGRSFDAPSRSAKEYPLPRNPRIEAELFGKQHNTGINFDKYEDIPVDASGQNVPEPIANVRHSAQKP
jgi:ATP-dependent RNA helicase DDX3X